MDAIKHNSVKILRGTFFVCKNILRDDASLLIFHKHPIWEQTHVRTPLREKDIQIHPDIFYLLNTEKPQPGVATKSRQKFSMERVKGIEPS